MHVYNYIIFSCRKLGLARPVNQFTPKYILYEYMHANILTIIFLLLINMNLRSSKFLQCIRSTLGYVLFVCALVKYM